MTAIVLFSFEASPLKKIAHLLPSPRAHSFNQSLSWLYIFVYYVLTSLLRLACTVQSFGWEEVCVPVNKVILSKSENRKSENHDSMKKTNGYIVYQLMRSYYLHQKTIMIMTKHEKKHKNGYIFMCYHFILRYNNRLTMTK